jgi:hypothetical protein
VIVFQIKIQSELVVGKSPKEFAKKPETTEAAPQWEEEYELYPAGRYLLTTEFMEMSELFLFG